VVSVARIRGLALLVVLLALDLASPALAAQEPWSSREERARTFDAVVDVFERYYWDPEYRDWDEWSVPFRDDALTAQSREAFDRVLSRMVRELDDEHSTWLGLVEVSTADAMPVSHQPRLGFQARLLRGTGLVIERVYAGSPAASAGLQRGDVLVAVDDSDFTGTLSSGRVWATLAGAADRGRATLRVRRGRELLELEIEPAPFEIARAQDLPQAEMLDERMGYLYLPSFNREDIAERVHRLITELQDKGLTELVVDMRGNPGGRLGELGLALGAFLEGTWARAVSRGEIIWEGRYEIDGSRGAAWLEDPAGRVILSRAIDRPATFRGPIAVLVNRHNSSAGELAAMALQAGGRAFVVGEATGGNVEAIRGFDLPDRSVVMVAIANLEAPDGTSFSEGVVPDFIARESLSELANGYDAPLAEAIRLLRGLPFTPNRYFGQSATY
jgi:carboxyl-terminal processing protease